VGHQAARSGFSVQPGSSVAGRSAACSTYHLARQRLRFVNPLLRRRMRNRLRHSYPRQGRLRLEARVRNPYLDARDRDPGASACGGRLAGVAGRRVSVRRRHHSNCIGIRFKPRRGWGWVLFDSLLSIGLAILIAIGWPQSSLAFVGLLTGFTLISAGIWRTMLRRGSTA
jgi:hypothetical protein